MCVCMCRIIRLHLICTVAVCLYVNILCERLQSNKTHNETGRQADSGLESTLNIKVIVNEMETYLYMWNGESGSIL